MTHRERIASIYSGRPTDRPGFWLGNPSQEVYARLFDYLGVDNDEDMRRKIGDDCRWLPSDHMAQYKHPEGRPIFDIMYARDAKISHCTPGYFADCEDPAQVADYPWPDAKYLDLGPLKTAADERSEYFRFGGTWSCFFHNVMDYFGIEQYFMKMYTHPEVVHAVTARVVEFYIDANRRVFTEMPETVDAFFFGNDFGTQEDLFMAPDKFREFVLPYFKELIDLAKSFGKMTQLHSCGAISKAIPMLVEAGMDGLHPLQARAKGMEAETLARLYKGKIVFVGGVDTQELMWRGTPQQVKDEVNRLRDIFGERWIISPSHEVLLPEVPVENVIALCEAATGASL